MTENLETVDHSLTGLTDNDLPVTVQTYLYKEKHLSTGINPYKPYRITVHANHSTEKLKCFQLGSDDTLFVPVAYPYPVSYVPVFSDTVYAQVSDLIENRKYIPWFTNTQFFVAGEKSFPVGTIFQVKQRRKFSIKRKQRNLQVLVYPQMVLLELLCGVTGSFMRCCSPEEPIKKMIQDIVQESTFPFLFSFGTALGSLSIFASSRHVFHTVIASQSGKEKQNKLMIFPSHLARKVLFLGEKRPLNQFCPDELDDIKAFIDTNFHTTENFFIKFSYERRKHIRKNTKPLYDGIEDLKEPASDTQKRNANSFIGREDLSVEEETYLVHCLSNLSDGYVNVNQVRSSIDADGYMVLLPGAGLTIKETEEEDTDDEFDKHQGEIEKEKLQSYEYTQESTDSEFEETVDDYENSARITLNEITKGDDLQQKGKLRQISTSSTTTPSDVISDPPGPYK